ncbi:hypothetical protein U0C82_11565 [Fulvimarina sp. 2208YS6-2-32]|uniref:Uncharacterized protein n=1 Tax=Fulvimarina uroteuthidis TaxID=3098149 RepID=A0ABU5I351_9HYPH|nr:hypothetical protein [Fulvimarina sp. 2208YS6-2-32]MDY8109777.1 hypothetical protein [Fulvimarina sp. 2208YS6-2-32]
MLRTASTVCLAAWTAFLAIGAMRLLIEAGALPAGLQTLGDELMLMARQGGPVGIDASAVLAFSGLLVAIAIVLGASIVRLNSWHRPIAATGEQTAMAGLAAIFAFWLSAEIAGSPIATLFGSGSGVCLALAVTLGALVFDHMMHADESESDEAFEAVMRRIENRSNGNNDNGDL